VSALSLPLSLPDDQEFRHSESRKHAAALQRAARQAAEAEEREREKEKQREEAEQLHCQGLSLTHDGKEEHAHVHSTARNLFDAFAEVDD